MDIEKLIYTAASAAMAFIIWGLRLEGKVRHIEKVQETDGERIAKAIDKMSESQGKMAEQINEMRTTLAGVVGYEKGASDTRARRLK